MSPDILDTSLIPALTHLGIENYMKHRIEIGE